MSAQGIFILVVIGIPVVIAVVNAMNKKKKSEQQEHPEQMDA